MFLPANTRAYIGLQLIGYPVVWQSSSVLAA
jgi:hypothetical protein